MHLLKYEQRHGRQIFVTAQLCKTLDLSCTASKKSTTRVLNPNIYLTPKEIHSARDTELTMDCIYSCSK